MMESHDWLKTEHQHLQHSLTGWPSGIQHQGWKEIRQWRIPQSISIVEVMNRANAIYESTYLNCMQDLALVHSNEAGLTCHGQEETIKTLEQCIQHRTCCATTIWVPARTFIFHHIVHEFVPNFEPLIYLCLWLKWADRKTSTLKWKWTHWDQAAGAFLLMFSFSQSCDSIMWLWEFLF